MRVPWNRDRKEVAHPRHESQGLDAAPAKAAMAVLKLPLDLSYSFRE